MGHKIYTDREYKLLQKKLDRKVTGAPDSPTFMNILKLVFSPKDVNIALQIPGSLTSLEVLAQKTNMPVHVLSEKLLDMAQRGLVVDIMINNKLYYTLPPVVIGFFEFTFMRTRDDMPMKELAILFDQYMKENDRFARSVFQKETQIGRSLVHEEALPTEDYSEILDWERASYIVKNASAHAVSLCACRHKASHLGTQCDNPVENCLTLNHAAGSVVRGGYGRPISKDEALHILQTSKELGLAQTADNVQNQVSYICNCCGCCCGMIEAIKHFNLKHAIVTSNWIMTVNQNKCTGCGKCVNACPVDALALIESDKNGKSKYAVCDETLCLGCGVCYTTCKKDAVKMKSREKRVYTPETVFDRTIAMAIERGKLSNLIFDDPEKLSHRALARIFQMIEHSPPYKAIIAVQPLKSHFLETLVKKAKDNATKLSNSSQE